MYIYIFMLYMLYGIYTYHSRDAAKCAGNSSLRPYLRLRGREGQQRDPAKDEAWDVPDPH